MRETVVEGYLKAEVKKAGGTTRKFVSPGRPGVPDRIVIWSRTYGFIPYADVHFVETKAPGGKPEPHQKREHDRLRKFGCKVFVIDTKAKVDKYVKEESQ